MITVRSDIAKNLLADRTCSLCDFNRRTFLAGDSISQNSMVEDCVLNNNKEYNTCNKWKAATYGSVHYGTFIPIYATDETKLTLLDKGREFWKRVTQRNIF